MFCRKCGAELVSDAKFCDKCGASTGEEAVVDAIKDEKKVDNNIIRYTLKPTFNYGYKICTIIGRTLLFLLIVGIYFFGEIEDTWVYLALANKLKNIALIIIAILVIYILIKLFFEKKQYDKLEYNFYNNKLEYIDGFIDKEQKEVKYKNIREVTMSQNILERIFKIGTIKIFTNASSIGYSNNRHANMNRNGIVVHCVTDVREKYLNIKKIIDESAEE